ncbi:hypothetical protein ISCGN_029278 [Ixodes scapularis]
MVSTGTQTSTDDLRLPSRSLASSGAVPVTPLSNRKVDAASSASTSGQGLTSPAPPGPLAPKGRGLPPRTSAPQREPPKQSTSRGQLPAATDEPMDETFTEDDFKRIYLCSAPQNDCFLRRCEKCPKMQSISLQSLHLDEDEEICYALWDAGELVKKVMDTSAFLKELESWSEKPGIVWVPEGRGAIPRPLGGRAVRGARVAKPCSLLGVGTPTSFLVLGGGVCRTTPEVEGDPDGTRRSSEDVCVPVDTIGRAGPLCTASAYEPREANKTRFFASWYGMFSWTFNDTRLREAGVEAVYCLARGAPKGPNIPRAQLNHQGPLFPGHGYATHSQTWVGEPTWLGVRSDATHQAPTKVGAPCVRVWWPTWLGSVVTLLTKHLAPKVQAPPAGLGVRGDATLQTPALTGAPCGGRSIGIVSYTLSTGGR